MKLKNQTIPEAASLGTEAKRRPVIGAIGALFKGMNKARKARLDFLKMGIIDADIELIDSKSPIWEVRLQKYFRARQLKANQISFYQEPLEKGSILLVVRHVKDPFPVLAVFDRYGAVYQSHEHLAEHPVTIGAAAGAVTGAVIGGAVGGPAGAAGGSVMGGLIGSGVATGIQNKDGKKAVKKKREAKAELGGRVRNQG